MIKDAAGVRSTSRVSLQGDVGWQEVVQVRVDDQRRGPSRVSLQGDVGWQEVVQVRVDDQ